MSEQVTHDVLAYKLDAIAEDVAEVKQLATDAKGLAEKNNDRLNRMNSFAAGMSFMAAGIVTVLVYFKSAVMKFFGVA